MTNRTKRKQVEVQDDERREFNARVEEEVRRRLSEILGRAGLPEVGVAKEVLYWLPQEFVEWYEELFLAALKLDSRGRQGAIRTDTEGRTVDVGDNHRSSVGTPRRRRGESQEEFRDRAASTIGVGKGGGGKRYKQHYLIMDEEAFRIKGLVDRRLLDMVRGIGLRAREVK